MWQIQKNCLLKDINGDLLYVFMDVNIRFKFWISEEYLTIFN
jgi:hypothetical protein